MVTQGWGYLIAIRINNYLQIFFSFKLDPEEAGGVTMRHILLFMILLASLGHSFRITDFLPELSLHHQHHENVHERQSTDGNIIFDYIPTFLVTFVVSLFSNILFIQGILHQILNDN